MERAFLVSGIAMPVLVVLPLEVVRSRPARIFCMLGILWFGYLSLRSLPGRVCGEQTEQWREACAYANHAPGRGATSKRLTVCVANEGELLYDYYCRNSDYSPQPDLTGSPIDFFQLDPPRTMQRVREDADLNALQQKVTAGRYDSVVLICSHSWWGDHDQRTLSMLCREFKLVDQNQFKQICVFTFGR